MGKNAATVLVYLIIVVVLIAGDHLGMPHPEDVNGVMYGLQWAQLLVIINLWVERVRSE